VVTVSHDITAKALSIDSSTDGANEGDAALVVGSAFTLATTAGDLTLKALSIGHALADGNTAANVTVAGGNLIIDSNFTSGGNVDISSAAALDLGAILQHIDNTVTIQTTGAITTDANISAGGNLVLSASGITVSNTVTAKSMIFNSSTDYTDTNQIGDAALVVNATGSVLTTTNGDLTLKAITMGDDGTSNVDVVVVGGHLNIDGDHANGAGTIKIESASALSLGTIVAEGADATTIIANANTLTTSADIVTAGTLSLLGDGIIIANNVTAKVLTVSSSATDADAADQALVVNNTKVLRTTAGAMTLKAVSILDDVGAGGEVSVLVDGTNNLVIAGDAGAAANNIKIHSTAALRLGSIAVGTTDTVAVTSDAGLSVHAAITSGGLMTVRGKTGVHFEANVTAKSLDVKAGADAVYDQKNT
jgi:hypothetical protein